MSDSKTTSTDFRAEDQRERRAEPEVWESADQSRLLLDAILDQSPVGMMVVSMPDLVLRRINRAAMEGLGIADEPSLLNLPLQEIVRRQTWKERLLDGGQRSEVRWIERAMCGEASPSFEFTVLREDGTERWLTGGATPIRDGDGKIVAVALVFRDTTEIRTIVEQLRRLAEERETILDTVTTGIALFKGETIQWVNRAFAEMLGCAPEEIVGGTMQPFHPHPEDFARIKRESTAALAQGLTYRTEVLQRRKSGATYWCEVTGRAVPAQGMDESTLWVLQDITARRDSEEALRGQAKLQEQLQQAMKMEAVGRLAGGVAHDFNNLLTVIAGNTELAKMDLNPVDPLVQYLEQIAKATQSASELTRQLLAFSRRQIIEPRTVDLNDLIGGLRKMLGRLIGEDITLETALAGDLAAVKVDPGQFEQVIVNLAVNARDAMPDGGKLLIETANVEIDGAWCAANPELKPGRFVMLAMTDTGHGMDKETRGHLFEPFFTTKPVGRGTGLGLAVIFGVVHQAGGAINVYSEVGHGTTFRIYLPSTDAAAERALWASVVDELPRGSESILLVEDDASVRDLAATFLKRQGYKVVETPNGGEALVYAEQHREPIALLFTDMVLPGMNGRELAERVRRIHPEIAVLFASGYTEDAILRWRVMSDESHFIGKPYSLQTIARRVREVLDEAARGGHPG